MQPSIFWDPGNGVAKSLTTSIKSLEEIIEIPMISREEKRFCRDLYGMPTICDVVEEEHEAHWGRLPPSVRSRLACIAFVNLSDDLRNTHACFLCPACKRDLMAGSSLRLRN